MFNIKKKNEITELKIFKVSILLMKKSFIKNNISKSERKQIKNFLENKRIKFLKKSLNVHSQNNINKLLNRISDKKSFKSDGLKNMKVQTTLSSSVKTFRTPYQIIHLKNKMLKNLFDYSKNNKQNINIEKQFNEEIINIRSFSTREKNKRNEKLILKEKLNLKSLSWSKKYLISKKIMKKNKTLNPVMSSPEPSISYNNFNNNNFLSNKNEIPLNEKLKDKSNLKLKFKYIKSFRPNCYYNKLNLEKLSNILRKFSFVDIEKN